VPDSQKRVAFARGSTAALERASKMSKRRVLIWILSVFAGIATLYIGSWGIYVAGVEAGAELAVQESRNIGFTGQSLRLRELLEISDDLDRKDTSSAQGMLDMLSYHQYTRLEEDAKGGGLLEGTERMKKEIEGVRDTVRIHCASTRPPRAEFDVCAELAKRSNNAFQRTLEDSRR
jgi:hypothetical protein